MAGALEIDILFIISYTMERDFLWWGGWVFGWVHTWEITSAADQCVTCRLCWGFYPAVIFIQIFSGTGWWGFETPIHLYCSGSFAVGSNVFLITLKVIDVVWWDWRWRVFVYERLEEILASVGSVHDYHPGKLECIGASVFHFLHRYFWRPPLWTSNNVPMASSFPPEWWILPVVFDL